MAWVWFVVVLTHSYVSCGYFAMAAGSRVLENKPGGRHGDLAALHEQRGIHGEPAAAGADRRG